MWSGDFGARVERSAVADDEVLRVGAMFNLVLDGWSADRARRKALAVEVIRLNVPTREEALANYRQGFDIRPLGGALYALVSLPAGDYWVSLTPRHNLGLFPYSVAKVVTDGVVGDPSRVVIACTANTDWLLPLAPAQWDYAMKIEGDQPVPAIDKTWGGIKAIYR